MATYCTREKPNPSANFGHQYKVTTHGEHVEARTYDQYCKLKCSYCRKESATMYCDK